MGLDLRLLPFDCDNGDFAYSHTILSCDRDSQLFDAIRELNQLSVTGRFYTFTGRQEGFEDVCYGNTQKTPYGEPVKFAIAGDLYRCFRNSGGTGVNSAIRAYLQCLEPQTKVALYWH